VATFQSKDDVSKGHREEAHHEQIRVGGLEGLVAPPPEATIFVGNSSKRRSHERGVAVAGEEVEDGEEDVVDWSQSGIGPREEVAQMQR